MADVRDSDDELQYGYRVTGVVQGVGFRFWTCRVAHQLGIRGTVRNCADGSVEVLAVGNAGALRDFEARLRQGPPGSTVRAVEHFDPGNILPYNDFSVVH
ncbi:MAG: acylphosphatase [Gemmatimonadetes bacterium]|nr:acylphosphatase [Gemmatimonadota bacterium]